MCNFKQNCKEWEEKYKQNQVLVISGSDNTAQVNMLTKIVKVLAAALRWKKYNYIITYTHTHTRTYTQKRKTSNKLGFKFIVGNT